MKFGEHLTVHLTPEWQSQYIEYEYMKTLLEEAKATAPTLGAGDDKMLLEEFYREVDVAFFQFCDKQLKKISTFFAEKLAEAMRRFETLKDELDFIKPNEYHGHLRKLSTVSHRRVSIVIHNSNFADRLENSSSSNGWISSVSKAVSSRLVGQNADNSSQKHYKSLSSLKKAFTEFYLMLILLQNFQALNFTGFRKILKKHDKIFDTNRGDEWRKIHVDNAPFHTSIQVTELIKHVEKLFTEELESGNRTAAMKRLRVPPLGEKNSIIVAFRFGVFFGMICLLLPALFAFISELANSRSNKPLGWRPALQLYRSTCLIIVQIIFAGINVYGWSTSGVNHILIFEIDPRHHLNYQRILELGTGLFVLWLLSFVSFVLMSFYDCYPFVQPFAFLIFMALFAVNPLPIFYRDARFWLLRKVARVFSAPFYPVGFTDFWLGDQLTSLELVFFDMASFFCFYVSDHSWWLTDLTSPATPQGVFCSNWSAFFLQCILLLLPSWFRFAQCLRRYRDTKEAFPHLANAGKYATGFFIAITNSLRRATAKTYADNRAANPCLYLWIIAAIVGAIYKLIWDLKMDWGFFDKKAGANKYLREQLVYSSKVFYYAAIVEDIVLRFIWIINIFLIFNDHLAEYSDFIGFAFGIAEIFRRFVWNFFRLENEHLNNCGKFRAVRDISVTPITTGIDFKRIDHKLKQEPGIRRRRQVAPTISVITEETTSMTDLSVRDGSEKIMTGFIHDYIPRNDTIDIDDVETSSIQTECVSKL